MYKVSTLLASLCVVFVAVAALPLLGGCGDGSIVAGDFDALPSGGGDALAGADGFDPWSGSTSDALAGATDGSGASTGGGASDAHDEADYYEPGCPTCGDLCESNEDCPSGWCVPGPNGLFCTTHCDGECPPGMTCTEVATPVGDPVFICLHNHVYYCSPCAVDADCAPALVTISPNHCVTREDGSGSFCGTTCAVTADCPPGASCDAVDIGGGAVANLCRPKAGDCECTVAAVSAGSSTVCFVTSEAGSCEGSRGCTDAGLSACDAAMPVEESCNGVDDDCDGETDEDFALLGTACDGGDADLCPEGVWLCDGGALLCDDDGESQAEACNGVDDDCDGETDEEHPLKGQPCDGDDEDQCADGVWNCSPDGGVECVDDPGSKAESCNDLDDDCDGQTDEDYLDKGAPCDGADEDTCEDGVMVCAPDGQGVVCEDEPGTSAEICNEIDDDCDGQTDEGFDAKGAACDGEDADQCTDGQLVCGPDGGLVCDDDAEAIVETCDDHDDDCDGATDEDFGFKGQPCDGEDSDLCPDGVWACDAFGGLSCEDDAASATEVCNDADDDCDGVTDEGFGDKGLACDGDDLDLCLDGVWVCDAAQGVLVCDDDHAAAIEACNGADDDCDGQTDEDFAAKGTACDGDDADSCLDGTWLCNGIALICDDDGFSKSELCNALDDDCDGAVDEAFPDKGQPCDGNDADQCADGFWLCNGTDLVCNDDALTKGEVCNDVDDDCDGDTDEGYALKGQACDGDDLDDCADGMWVCGVTGGLVCNDLPGGSSEICNEIDDDCDGATDEGFPNKGTACDGPDPDLCAEGTWICDGGGGLMCSDTTGDSTEICDDEDNDCDGTTDEGYETKGQPCDGPDGDSCVEGTYQCDKQGALVCSDGTGTTVEVCNDVDDDCDGATDEGFGTKGQACDGGDGDLCKEGTWQCDGVGLACSDNTGTNVEVCNDADDDCDGSTDETFSNKGQPCDGGDGDLCKEGTFICNGTTLVCTDNTGTKTESCNNQDDDCDGSTDEGLSQGCSTTCGSGTQTCSKGNWGTCSAQQPKTCYDYSSCSNKSMCVSSCPSKPSEVCNLVDDDCDGSTDEGFTADASNGSSDYPNSWSTSIPIEGVYPGTKSGTLYGKLLPQGDHDWWSIQATEDLSDFCITNDMDQDIVGKVVFNSPGSGLWYEICACWSSASGFCEKSSQKCATSINGGTVTVQVNMNMTCTQTDKGWMDVEIRPDTPSLDKSCSNWTAAWSVFE